MIIEEIWAAIGDRSDDGSRMNAIADEFRRGRPAEELYDALLASDLDVVRLGCWILSEIDFSKYNKNVFLSRLKELVNHTDSGVRFNALIAIFPALMPADEQAVSIVRRALEDDDAGVRLTAQAAARRLGIH